MKTIREWFEYLPKDIRDKAVANSSNNILSCSLESLHKSIIWAIDWSTSKEGYKYWSSIYNRASNGKYDTPTKSYHNSVGISGAELSNATSKAEALDKEVMKCFRKLDADGWSTPEEVYNHLIESGKNCLRSSVRRSFSNLKSAGKIEFTGKKIMGGFGSRINTSRLTKND